MEVSTKLDRSGIYSPTMDMEGNLIAELQKLDLTPNEAKILVFLLSEGQSNASDISRRTGIQRTETYNYISNLLSKGIVFSTFDRPQKYYSIPIEEVVDSLIQSKKTALEVFENKKNSYKTMLETLIGNKVVRQEDKKEKYNFVMGENAVASRIAKMITDAKEEVLALVTDRNLVNFYHTGITDQLIQLATNGMYVKLRTPCKNVGDYIIPGDKDSMLFSTMEKIAPTSFIIVDNKEIIILLESHPFKKSELCGFYTNNLSLISIFKFLFENVS